MNLITTLFLAFGLSMDSFAVALCKGATLNKPGLRSALRIGLIFGLIEMMMPVMGWSIGIVASRYIMEWDHWLAFTLLSILGCRMIINGLKQSDQSACDEPARYGFAALAFTAFATSLDALAVGVSLAFLQVNILLTASAIGMATMLMAMIGVLIGRYIGPILGKWAEVMGGLVMISIGVTILVEHLGLIN